MRKLIILLLLVSSIQCLVLAKDESTKILKQVEKLIKKNKLEAAKLVIDELVPDVHSSNKPDALFLLGVIYSKQDIADSLTLKDDLERRGKAIEALNQCVNLTTGIKYKSKLKKVKFRPEDALQEYFDFFYYKAIQFVELDEIQAALNFERASSILLHDTLANQKAAELYHLNGFDEKAINLYEKSINNGAKDKDIIHHLCHIYHSNHKDEEGLSMIKQIRKRNHRNDLELYKLEILFMVYFHRENEVLKFLDDKLKRRPKSFFYLFAKAYVFEEKALITDDYYKKIGLFEKAIEIFRKAVAIRPNHIDAQYNLSLSILDKILETQKEINLLKSSKKSSYRIRKLQTSLSQYYKEAHPEWARLKKLNSKDVTIDNYLTMIERGLNK